MTLVILEVSRKQDYIFSSRAIKDNVRRSQEIAYVTGNGGGAFFRQAAGELFQEEQLTVDECADYLLRIVDVLRSHRPDVQVVFTVSPIRYRKYGYHESQLSKATLLLATEQVCSRLYGLSQTDRVCPCQSVAYFPAYEIVLDELRDYRFYKDDMLHPSPQAVEYIWQQLVEHYFSPAAKEFLREWAPLKAALGHRPFDPDSEAYRDFMDKTMLKVAELQKKYPTFAP